MFQGFSQDEQKKINQKENFKFTICKNEIAFNDLFEKNNLAALKSGLEVSPSPISYINDKNKAMINAYGDPWIRAEVDIYSKGGKIIYKKISTNDYEISIEW